MILYDNDAHREEFMELVYDLLRDDGTNDRANQIIAAFDSVPEVEAEPLQPNGPLTLEELREMDGEPVFCFSKRAAEDSAYGIACIRDNVPYVRTIQNKGTSSRFFYLTTYGTAWLAYHRKPEEVTT